MGRNVQFYCECYGVCIQDVLSFSEQRRLLLDEDMICHPEQIHELVLILKFVLV